MFKFFDMLKFLRGLKKKKPLVLISIAGDKKTGSKIALVKKPKSIGDLITLYMNDK